MKQNAVGLASICILSTGVLLMISSTVCLNSGLDDIMNKRCPADVNVLYRGNSYEDLEKMREKLLGKIENQVSYEKINTEIAFSSTLVGSEDGSWKFANVDGSSLMAMPASLETLTVCSTGRVCQGYGRRDFPCAQVKFLLTTMEKQTVRLWRFITRFTR